MHLSRRHLIQGLISALLLPRHAFASNSRNDSMFRNNFQYVYSDPTLRAAFLRFLQNVFHLYPESEFDAAIAAATAQQKSDREIYLALQPQLLELKPFLADLRLSLPALAKQKMVITTQTQQLIGTRKRIDGYLEFGSGGRYLDSLEKAYSIVGERYLVHSRPSNYGPVDVMDRGQLLRAGTEIALDDYAVSLEQRIPPNSLDMVTMYIGFHHCPLDRRDSFVHSIRNVLKPGGLLVVRDHNAFDDSMQHMVALAHDVFNLGTKESWHYNEAEFRAFYSLDQLELRLTNSGFSHDGRRLYQDGDPTLNALMLFRKV